MSKLHDFLVAVTDRYREEGGDVVDVVNVIADVLVEQGYTIITNKQYIDLCSSKHKVPKHGHCPHCGQSLGKPALDYSQGGYSRTTWICAECGATLVHMHYPPES